MGGIAVGGAAEIIAGAFALTAGVGAVVNAANGNGEPDEAHDD